MPEYATATVSYGLEPMTRTDMFEKEHEDAVVRFGAKNRGKWLSECSRYWMAWLFAIKVDSWPDDLLDLVMKWGKVKSEGKPEHFGELVDAQLAKIEKGKETERLQPRLL